MLCVRFASYSTTRIVSMLRTIELDNELGAMTHEIRKVATDRSLPSKMHPKRLQ
jgi:hypothetical protein